MANPEVTMSLEDAVQEVLSALTGLDITYKPELDRFRAVTRHLNKAMRLTALDAEWSYYSSIESVGFAHTGDTEVALRATVRPRIINDDQVRLVDRNGRPQVWAAFLDRTALHKYVGRSNGLWVAHTKSSLQFSRPIMPHENGLEIMVPVMREPRMFRLPPAPDDTAGQQPIPVPEDILQQQIDFDYPDLVIARAVFLYAQTDPIAQPRLQSLEEQFKNIMYALTERDERNTDSTYQNEWFLPIDGSLDGPMTANHGHPHSDDRRWE